MLFIARLGTVDYRNPRINLPETFLQLAAARLAWIPLPIWILVTTAAVAQFTLSCTPFGRQLYAVGHDPAAARKAGIAVDRIQLAVYAISAIAAAVGGMIVLAPGRCLAEYGAGA